MYIMWHLLIKKIKMVFQSSRSKRYPIPNFECHNTHSHNGHQATSGKCYNGHQVSSVK